MVSNSVFVVGGEVEGVTVVPEPERGSRTCASVCRVVCPTAKVQSIGRLQVRSWNQQLKHRPPPRASGDDGREQGLRQSGRKEANGFD